MTEYIFTVGVAYAAGISAHWSDPPGPLGYDWRYDPTQDGVIDVYDWSWANAHWGEQYIIYKPPPYIPPAPYPPPKVWVTAATVEYTFFRILGSDNDIKDHFLEVTSKALESIGYEDTDRATNPVLTYIKFPGIHRVTVEIAESTPGAFPPVAILLAAIGGILIGMGVAWIIMIETKLKPIQQEARKLMEDLDKIEETLRLMDERLDIAWENDEITLGAYDDLKGLTKSALDLVLAAKEHGETILDYTKTPDWLGGLGDIMEMMPMILMMVLLISVIGVIPRGRRD